LEVQADPKGKSRICSSLDLALATGTLGLQVRTGERRSIRGFTHRGIEIRLKIDTSSPSARIGEDSSDAVRVAGGAR
jgi:hypothetical protein